MDRELVKAAFIPGRLYRQMGRFVEAEKRRLDFEARVNEAYTPRMTKGLKIACDVQHIMSAAIDVSSTMVGLYDIAVTGAFAAGLVAEGKPVYAFGAAVGVAMTCITGVMRGFYFSRYVKHERKAQQAADGLQRQLLGYVSSP